MKKRLQAEGGFTLIELLVVMIILAILTAIAVPSYLTFRDRANKTAAATDVRAIIPSIEAYFADNGTYTGMTIASLKASYDQSIDGSIYSFGTLAASSYCIQATSPNDAAKSAFKIGPSGAITEGTCP